MPPLQTLFTRQSDKVGRKLRREQSCSKPSRWLRQSKRRSRFAKWHLKPEKRKRCWQPKPCELKKDPEVDPKVPSETRKIAAEVLVGVLLEAGMVRERVASTATAKGVIQGQVHDLQEGRTSKDHLPKKRLDRKERPLDARGGGKSFERTEWNALG